MVSQVPLVGASLVITVGNPQVTEGQPVPVPVKTCTHRHGYGLAQVRVQVGRGHVGQTRVARGVRV